MLAGEHFGRGHESGLVLVGDGDQQGVDRHSRFAGANVGLQQPLHWPIRGQIPADRGDGPVLILRQANGNSRRM